MLGLARAARTTRLTSLVRRDKSVEFRGMPVVDGRAMLSGYDQTGFSYSFSAMTDSLSSKYRSRAKCSESLIQLRRPGIKRTPAGA